MALAFDPNRTFFRGINKYKQIHISIYRKKKGKGLREGSRKKRENDGQSKFLFEKYFLYIYLLYIFVIYIYMYMYAICWRGLGGHTALMTFLFHFCLTLDETNEPKLKLCLNFFVTVI